MTVKAEVIVEKLKESNVKKMVEVIDEVKT
jgi:hypothetical protein